MGLQRTTDPVNEPISQADAKKQCEVGSSDTTHNDHIDRLIAASRQAVERWTRRALITQTWQLTLRRFPYSHEATCGGNAKIELPRPPLQSVTSIQYVDDSGATQTLSSSLYQVNTSASPGYVEPAFGEVWPTTRTETAEAVTITYVAGYGDAASDVPETLVQSIAELVAFQFMNRGDVNTDIPQQIRWALDSMKCGATHEYYGIKQ